jgi:putative oxidoreductase
MDSMNTRTGIETEQFALLRFRLALAELAGRILLAVLFLDSGLAKLMAYGATLDYMASSGVPGELLPAVIALEILGGLALIAGWKTRVVSFLLAGFTLMSGAIFHGDLGDPGDRIHLLKNLSIFGGFILVIVHGPGAISLDRRTGSG